MISSYNAVKKQGSSFGGKMLLKAAWLCHSPRKIEVSWECKLQFNFLSYFFTFIIILKYIFKLFLLASNMCECFSIICYTF